MKPFFKANELSKLTGVSLETIRYYEKVGLLPKPPRAENGYRLFTQESVDLLHFVKTCRSLGFSVDEIKQLNELQKDPTHDCHNIDELVAKHIEQVDVKIQQLYQIRTLLENMQGCQGGEVASCKAISSLKSL